MCVIAGPEAGVDSVQASVSVGRSGDLSRRLGWQIREKPGHSRMLSHSRPQGDRQLEELSAAVKLTRLNTDKGPVGGADRTGRSAHARRPRAFAVVRQNTGKVAEGTEEFLFTFSSSTKSRSAIHGGEQFHLLDGDFVQAREALGLAQSFADEEGIEILQI